MRHIFKAFHSNAVKLGIDSVWVDDRHPISLQYGDTVIAADVTAANLPYETGVDYVLHNFSGDDPLCDDLRDTPEHLLRLQVWTKDASGEVWAPCRQFDLSARTLFQPWGADLLKEEFLEPVFNPDSHDCVFVGAVWSDQYQGVELGNKQTINKLREACYPRRLRFVHRTQISDAEMIDLTRAARVAPAFAGDWQVSKGYIPCRYLKTPAFGALAFGNVPEAEALLGGASLMQETLEGTLDAVLSLGRGRYLALVREQQQAISLYTYRQSLAAIERALEEIKA